MHVTRICDRICKCIFTVDNVVGAVVCTVSGRMHCMFLTAIAAGGNGDSMANGDVALESDAAGASLAHFTDGNGAIIVDVSLIDLRFRGPRSSCTAKDYVDNMSITRMCNIYYYVGLKMLGKNNT